LSDNLGLLLDYVKFAIGKKMEIGQKKKIETKLEYWKDGMLMYELDTKNTTEIHHDDDDDDDDDDDEWDTRLW